MSGGDCRMEDPGGLCGGNGNSKNTKREVNYEKELVILNNNLNRRM